MDGAEAARAFVRENGGHKWDKHRLQLVWDAIALHTTADIAMHKQLEVAIVSVGTIADVIGPELAAINFGDLVTINETEWEDIMAEFPRQGMKDFIFGSFTRLCRFKPETTYQNPIGDWGEALVDNYTRVGHRMIDLMEME